MLHGWRVGVGLVALFLSAESAVGFAQEGPVAAFKSAVEVVRVNAIVRDRKGRFVRDLSAHDFEIMDGDRVRTLTDFQHEQGGVSVALLFDVSGSMEGQLPNAREAATHVLSWLDADKDEASILTFDTRLDEVTPFTAGLRRLPEKLSGLTPFGATSLYDAIAQTSERMTERQGRRRAILVFTDGNDNASRLTPGEVSGIASAIDVPVYIVDVVAEIDNPSADISTGSVAQSTQTGRLSDLAAWTGGNTFVVSTISQRSAFARQVVEELRHQYVMVFESGGQPGWHPLTIRARNKDQTVRARSGYMVGQFRPRSD
jgi:Ca-activated chloride channel family protein